MKKVPKVEEPNNLNSYQKFANAVSGHEFEKDPKKISHELLFNMMGLAGEAGEAVEKIKKVIRISNFDIFFSHIDPERKQAIAYELGDCLYYLARVASILGFTLSEIATLNEEKLIDRITRGVIIGEGDNR